MSIIGSYLYCLILHIYRIKLHLITHYYINMLRGPIYVLSLSYKRTTWQKLFCEREHYALCIYSTITKIPQRIGKNFICVAALLLLLLLF